jgi:hypothetical protein
MVALGIFLFVLGAAITAPGVVDPENAEAWIVEFLRHRPNWLA